MKNDFKRFYLVLEKTFYKFCVVFNLFFCVLLGLLWFFENPSEEMKNSYKLACSLNPVSCLREIHVLFALTVFLTFFSLFFCPKRSLKKWVSILIAFAFAFFHMMM